MRLLKKLLSRRLPDQGSETIRSSEDMRDHEYWKSMFSGAARNISEALPFPVCTIDKHFRYAHFNKAYADVMKTYFSADIHLGTPVLDDFRNEREREGLKEIFQKVLRGETIKTTFTAAPGLAQRILETVFLPVRDENQEITGIASLSTDITDHVRSAEAIERISSRLQLATEAAGIGTWEWDIVRNKLVFDEQMFRLYGWSKGQHTALEVWNAAVHPEDRAAEHEISQRALRGEGTYDAEFRVVWPDGTVRWLKSKGKVIRSDAGQPVIMTGVDYDITEQKLATTKLSQLTRLYAIQVEVAQAMVRIRNRSELFQTICDLMVRQGGFDAAWIGTLDPDTGIIGKETGAGEAIDPWPYPEINIRQGLFRNGLLAQALHSRNMVVNDDIATDKRLREVHETLKLSQFQSIAVVPFGPEGQPARVLNLLAREKRYFMQGMERKLLTELGEDISFALMMMEKDEKISRSTEALRESEAKYRLISENAGDVIWVMDPESGRFTYVNPLYTNSGGTPQRK